MHYSTAILAFVAAVAAAPLAETGPSLCPAGLYSNPQCCATDVLGVADLDCANPATTPSDLNSFISTCAGRGQRARCCVIPVAGQAVLCQGVSPSGGASASSVGGGAPGAPTGAPGAGAGASSSSCSTSAAAATSAARSSKPAAPSPPAATSAARSSRPAAPTPHAATSTGCGC